MTGGVPYASARSIADGVRTGELSPVDVVETYLDRIERFNPDLNALVTVSAESAREAAAEAERAVERGDDLGPLHGVPVAIKDLNRTRGVRTTFGSTAFADNVPEEDDTVVARLREAGAVVVGKTNTPEFGRKTVTDNPLFGASANPWDLDRTTGGSSGGSAAAVAAGLVPLALGSDAAGSIRIPSSACGVFGLLPDFGRVPDGPDRPDAFENVLPYTFLGPIARTVGDAALMLDVMAGPDVGEPYGLPAPEGSYLDALDAPVSDLTIGYSPTFGGFQVDPAVRDAVEDALDALSAAGATVTELDLSFADSWDDRHDALEWILQQRYVGLYENLKRTASVDLLDADREITPEVVSRIEAGLDLDAGTMAAARRRRTAVYETVQRGLEGVDVLATPTLSRTAPELGTTDPTVDGEPVHPMHGWTLTWPLNLSGNPAGSIPVGFDDGLPVGMQLVGDRLDDRTVVAACAAVERELPWIGSYPPAGLEGGA
ncbi:amidase [Halorarum salinum]|uniref:Amidase n=1 Tax=Halorarum salinum TaxID=2743089 RepID=A0A7D5LDJ0_9EURY|nr:amidase [Halobaculum salinum]QLG63415.1 amidase [Halobaculum salinum]